jgi:hypothetical protein
MINVMLSSTILDMGRDRASAKAALEALGVVSVSGVDPVHGSSQGASPFLATAQMAEDCHLYILLLGRRYGYVTQLAKSATEVEFEAAYHQDPTKILVFHKMTQRTEKAQAEFIKKVNDYHKGYYIRRYETPSELESLVSISFQEWLQERAGIGARLNYFDHFVRIAIQRSPFPGVQTEYSIDGDHLELQYRIVGKTYHVHFDKGQLYSDFWGSLVQLERRFREWKDSGYGTGP